MGDECLIAVASAISDAVRSSDAVCRWGGDEIAIILSGADQASAVKTAEKVRAAVESLRFRSKDAEDWISITASIGVATTVCDLHSVPTVPQNFSKLPTALYIRRNAKDKIAWQRPHALLRRSAGMSPRARSRTVFVRWADQGEVRPMAPAVSESQVC